MDNPIERFDTSPQPLTIQYAKRSVVMLTVTKDELQSVTGLGASVYLAFFGTCLGALISFGVVLSTATISSPYALASYVALSGVAVLGTFLFGIKSVQEYKRCKRQLKRLTQDEQ